ncbi:MAG: putative alcohol dehydrogenase adh [Acidimicrobiia bacterium]|nr:MAG: putative alcohol dehydrogenase adh [Acidimicrobiia bacterium]
MVKAAVQVEAGRLEIWDLPAPGRGTAGALIRIEGCGMCGSDLESFRGAIVLAGLGSYPYVPGHEPVGRIEWIDPEMAERSEVSEGDRVAVEPFVPCGVCRHCTEGEYRLCRRRFIYSLASVHISPGLWGGFAQFMALRPGSILHRVPESVPIEDAVLFNPLGAGFEWAYRAAATRPGDQVAILGAGQRGLAAVIAVREAGADQVIVTGLSRDRHKLDLARALGATHTLVADEEPVVERIRELTGGPGADRVIDVTSNAPEAVAQAVGAARPGGTVVLAGLKDRHPVPGLVSDDIVYKNLTVKGVLGVSAWSFAQAIRIIASGRYPLHLLHTHTLKLDQLEQGLRLLAGQVEGETAVHITVVPG